MTLLLILCVIVAVVIGAVVVDGAGRPEMTCHRPLGQAV
jgi:hypothetical protein